MAENKIHNTPPVDWDATHHYGAGSVPPGCTPPAAGSLSVWVAGVPAPQGSKRALGAGSPGGKIRMVEMSKKLKPWRRLVRDAFKARPYGASVLTTYPKGTAVVAKIVFVCPRPLATPKTRATPPKTTKPDVDKLVRAVLDGIGDAGNVWADDSQVVTVHAHKRLAELGEPTGAMIHLEPVQAVTEPLRAGNAVQDPKRELCTKCEHSMFDHALPSTGCTRCMCAHMSSFDQDTPCDVV